MPFREVVSITTDDHPALAHTLERVLEHTKTEQIEGLTACRDWDDYKKRQGIIEGLNLALHHCREVTKRLNA